MEKYRHLGGGGLQLKGFSLILLAVLFLASGCRTTKQNALPDEMLNAEEAERPSNPLDPTSTDDLGDFVEGMGALQDVESGIVPIDGDSSLPDQLPALGLEDNPDAMADGFDRIKEPRDQLDNGIWWRSGADAIAKAQATNRPLLMWMANSSAGAIDRVIEEEVFSTEEFRKLMDDRLVGLKIDFGDRDVMASDYYRNLRERYKPRGAPTIILVLPDGTEETRYVGYRRNKGTPKGWVQRLAADVDQAEKSYQRWMDSLRASGYREWHDKKGNAFFARALRLDRARENVWLMDRYRQKYRVPLNRLKIGEREALLRTTEESD